MASRRRPRRRWCCRRRARRRRCARAERGRRSRRTSSATGGRAGELRLQLLDARGDGEDGHEATRRSRRRVAARPRLGRDLVELAWPRRRRARGGAPRRDAPGASRWPRGAPGRRAQWACADSAIGRRRRRLLGGGGGLLERPASPYDGPGTRSCCRRRPTPSGISGRAGESSTASGGVGLAAGLLQTDQAVLLAGAAHPGHGLQPRSWPALTRATRSCSRAQVAARSALSSMSWRRKSSIPAAARGRCRRRGRSRRRTRRSRRARARRGARPAAGAARPASARCSGVGHGVGDAGDRLEHVDGRGSGRRWRGGGRARCGRRGSSGRCRRPGR